MEFKGDEKLCVVEHLKEYLKRTQQLRGEHTQLFLSFIKPYHPVTKDGISRLVKLICFTTSWSRCHQIYSTQ
jgi:hypothetical protein